MPGVSAKRDAGRDRTAGPALALLLSLLLAACSTVSPTEPADESAGGGSLFSQLFPASKARPAAAPGGASPAYAAADPSLPCPPVEINPGTGSYRLFETGKDGDAMSLRYQATVVKMARECDGLGAEMAMRVGVIGRLVVGAKGGAGRVDVPVRIAVVDGQNQPVYSQLRTIPVEIGAGAVDMEFSHVEEGILVPVDDTRLRGWRVVIGFDDRAAAPAKKKG